MCLSVPRCSHSRGQVTKRTLPGDLYSRRAGTVYCFLLFVGWFFRTMPRHAAVRIQLNFPYDHSAAILFSRRQDRVLGHYPGSAVFLSLTVAHGFYSG